MVNQHTYESSIDDCLRRCEDNVKLLKNLKKMMKIKPQSVTDPGLPDSRVAEEMAIVGLNAKIVGLTAQTIKEDLRPQDV
jgi:hypothetical protein